MIGKFFDFGFKHYITPVVVGVLQYILYALIILFALGFLFSSFEIYKLIVVLISVPISMIGVRIWLEFIVAILKIAENSEEIKDLLKSNKPEI